MDNNAKELLDRSAHLFGKKEALNDLWQELAENYYPERASFTDEMPIGEEFASHLFDSFPVLARRDLGNAFASMLRPRGKPWFSLTVDHETVANDTEAMRWLEDKTGVMRRALYDRRAKFVREMKRGDHDVATFGNAVTLMDELQSKDGLCLSTHHLRDCAWAENYYGKVDLLYRKATVSARKLKQRFKNTKLHREIETACEKTPYQEFKIIHCVLPAADYEYVSKKKVNKDNLPFVSLFIDVDHSETIEETPLDYFPYVVRRWEMLSELTYAFSPAAMVAIPDARQIQSMARVLIEAGEKRVDPPIIATEETLKSEINLYSGGVTYIDREYDEKLGAALRPLDLGKDINLGIDMLVRTQNLIANAFYLNKLTLPKQGERTAYETSQLVEEFIREALPLFEPMEQDNALLLDTAFEFLMKRGAFGPREEMPDILAEQEISYTFSNPLQDAIDRNKVHSYLGAMEVVGKAALLDPTQVDHLKMDTATPDTIKGSGAPADWVRTEAELEEVRAERSEQEAAAAAMNEAKEAGEAVGGLAEASTKVSEAMNPQMAA